MEQLLGDCGKLAEEGNLADGVFVVEWERFPLHRSVLAARSEYSRARFKSGMHDGGTKEVCYEDVSASAFRVLLRFLYAGELPAWEGARSGGSGGSGGGAGGAGQSRGAGRGAARAALEKWARAGSGGRARRKTTKKRRRGRA